MDTDGGRSVNRSVSIFLVVAASLVAVAAVVLLVLDGSRTAMYFTLAGALVTIYLNVKNIRRGRDA